MNNHKTIWVVVLLLSLVLLVIMFYVGTLGLDKKGVYVPGII